MIAPTSDTAEVQGTRRLDLSTEEDGALHALYAEHHSPDVGAELLRRNERLAFSLAQRFAHRGETLEDLTQVALLAMALALKTFDPGRGCRFSTYAVPTILGELKRHFRDRAWLVKPPRRLQEVYLRVYGAVDDLEGRLGRAPTVAEVADHVDLPVEDVVAGMEVAGGRRGVSLDAPVRGGEDMSFGDVLGGDDRDLASTEEALFVGQLLGSLRSAEREVLVLSFFGELSQREIAERMGTTQMTVSRTRERALKRLRARGATEPAAA
ncbi:MAG: sig1 [Acidimicrobiales bacterium]|nr:sig1 [Acidimicrobiales bacterium]